MNKKNILLLSFLIFIIFLAVPQKIFAFVRCETQYGGGQVCIKTGEIQINKKVWYPEEEKYVDNLGLTNKKFHLDDEIIFKLEIKNVGDDNFGTVKVKDTLPEFLTLTSGEIDFEIKNLRPEQSVEKIIKAKVETDQLKKNNTTICDINTAEIWADDQYDKDSSQICAESGVLGVATLPPTGAQDWRKNLLTITLTTLLTIFFLVKNKIKKEVKIHE